MKNITIFCIHTFETWQSNIEVSHHKIFFLETIKFDQRVRLNRANLTAVYLLEELTYFIKFMS
jgi:hypothetical protein